MSTAQDIYQALVDGESVDIRLPDRREADSLRVQLYKIRAALNVTAAMFEQQEDTRIISMLRVSSDLWRYQFRDTALRPRKSYEIVANHGA